MVLSGSIHCNFLSHSIKTLGDEDFQKMGRMTSQVYARWAGVLKGNEQQCVFNCNEFFKFKHSSYFFFIILHLMIVVLGPSGSFW